VCIRTGYTVTGTRLPTRADEVLGPFPPLVFICRGTRPRRYIRQVKVHGLHRHDTRAWQCVPRVDKGQIRPPCFPAAPAPQSRKNAARGEPAPTAGHGDHPLLCCCLSRLATRRRWGGGREQGGPGKGCIQRMKNRREFSTGFLFHPPEASQLPPPAMETPPPPSCDAAGKGAGAHPPWAAPAAGVFGGPKEK
jgi:hypothetical protein